MAVETAIHHTANRSCLPRLRVYMNLDMIGVQVGGAVKNVMAIAAGISDGVGFGDNTKAAIVTRGISEIKRLGSSDGGETRNILWAVRNW